MTTTVAPPTELRSGLRYWGRSYVRMLRFDALSLRTYLPLVAIIQVLIGAGMALIYGFYFDEVPPTAALLIATGAPTLAVIPIGLALVPSYVSQQKESGTYDFVWSLPVPRLAAVLSTFTLYTAMALPGIVVALVVAAWRYDISLTVSLLVVPAVLVSALMATSVGFGMAHVIGNPRIVNFITNMIIFFVVLFSPIVFPREQMPGWMMQLHLVLPFYHMAVVIRAGLTEGLVTTSVAVSFAVLAVWTGAGWAGAAWMMGRRR